jgi:hypothetical protein
MTLFYSASTSGFYDDSIHSTVPSDAVEITAEEHMDILEALSTGKVLAAGTDGKPEAVARPKASLADYKAAAKTTLDALRKAEEAKGLSYTFPDSVTDVIQLRDNRDLLNVQSQVTIAQLLKSSGSTTTIPFQGESNATHEMTADEMIAMGVAVSTYIQSLYAISWAAKASVEAATDYDGVDAAAVWPMTSS